MHFRALPKAERAKFGHVELMGGMRFLVDSGISGGSALRTFSNCTPRNSLTERLNVLFCI